MSIVVSTEARIRDIEVGDDTITAHLVDGRVISVPLAWSWRLSEATPSQRRRYEIIGDGVQSCVPGLNHLQRSPVELRGAIV